MFRRPEVVVNPTPGDSEAPATTVAGNRWPDVTVPELGTWRPTLRASIIVPARDPVDLSSTLGALALQTYPHDLLEVVIVDDRSEPALAAPASLPFATRVVRSEGEGFGAGRARNDGVRVATGEMLLFVDADVLLSPRTVEAHARWHHQVGDAVVSGRLRATALESYRRLAGAFRQGTLLPESDVSWEPIEWVERLLERTAGLTARHPELWTIVAGANVSLRRATFERVGGFTPFGLRGIEDSELGYKLYIDGALFVPDDEAVGWHPDERHFSDPERTRVTRRRRLPPLLDAVPIAPIRPSPYDLVARVPRLVVHLDVQDQPFEEVTASIRSVLGDVTDAVVLVSIDAEHPDLELLESSVALDPRVMFAVAAGPFDLVHSPVNLHLDGPVTFPPGVLEATLRPLWRDRVGVVVYRDEPRCIAVATRAINRSARLLGRRTTLSSRPDDELLGVITEKFGVRRWPTRTLDTDPSGRAAARPLTAEDRLVVAASENAAARAERDRLAHELHQTRSALDRLRGRRIVRITDRLGRLRPSRRRSPESRGLREGPRNRAGR